MKFSCFGESSPGSFTKVPMEGSLNFWRVLRRANVEVMTFCLNLIDLFVAKEET